ncbi:MAG: glycosyltransferase, partial [Verrucomicrobiota bacterium]|nr:glycosyltransferase [Verrucomicrobiota bacterium]
MNDVPHIVLISIGTDGDIYPFLSLGEALVKRGFRVTLATHEHFAQNTRDLGLGFLSIVSNSETAELLQNPDFWHPLKGPLFIAR